MRMLRHDIMFIYPHVQLLSCMPLLVLAKFMFFCIVMHTYLNLFVHLVLFFYDSFNLSHNSYHTSEGPNWRWGE
jgi:hypothetical protein